MPDIYLPNNWSPRDYQRPAWDYLENGGKHAELIWHRRSGKDELALHRAAVAMVQRKGNYWHMLPEYGQARKAIWGAVNPHTGRRRIDEAFPPEIRSATREHEMQIVTKWGSTWQVVGSDRHDSLVGSTPAGIVYSEWALSNPDTRAYLRPIIAENKGWQIFITTARGRNHAYTTFKSAQKTPGAFTQILDATQTGVFSPEQLDFELDSYIGDYGEEYGRSKFEQEYLCSFDAANLGAILARAIGRLEKNGLINDQVGYDPHGATFEVFADIGRRDTSSWWFWQSKVGGYSLFDHDSGFGIDAEEWCERLQKRIRQYERVGGRSALGKIWLPHDARAKTFAAKNSAVEIFLKYFGAAHVAITPDSSKSDRVNAARVLISKCEFNSEKCAKGLEALRAWQYEYKEDAKIFSSEPLHDWASHDGDAFSYGCLVMQPAVKKEDKKQELRGITVGNNTVTLDELFAAQKKERKYY